MGLLLNGVFLIIRVFARFYSNAKTFLIFITILFYGSFFVGFNSYNRGIGPPTLRIFDDRATRLYKVEGFSRGQTTKRGS